MKCEKCNLEIDTKLHYSIETSSKRRGEIELCKSCGERLWEAEVAIEKARKILRELNPVFENYMNKKV